jgi:hypothetical protein
LSDLAQLVDTGNSMEPLTRCATIPIDRLRSEQDRISAEAHQVERLLAAADANLEE